MHKNRNILFFGGLIMSIFALFSIATAAISSAQSLGGGSGTIDMLEQWKSDGTNITQRTASKPIKITGLATGLCLTLDGSSILGTTACGSGGGGGGGGTFSTSTAWTNVLNNYSNNATDVVEIGGTSGTSTAKVFFDPNGTQFYRIGNTNTASTTIMGIFNLPTFSQGAFYLGSFGKVNTVATSTPTASTGLSYSGTMGSMLGGVSGNLTVNTSQNINTLSNLTSNGLVYTAGGGGVLNILATSTLSGSGVISVTAGAYTLGATPIVVSCATCGTGTVTGVTGTWPIISSGGATPNITFGGLSTTTALSAGQAVYASGVNTLASIATSTPTVTSPITYSGTLGSFIGGSSGAFACATCITTATTFSPSSIITSNSAGTLIATGTQLTVGNILATTTANNSFLGNILAPLGLVGTPSYSFNGDANTGMYSQGADSLDFTTGGVWRMGITSGGVVGIGSTNPTEVNVNSLLTVAKIGAIDVIASTTDNTTTSTAIFETYAPGARTFMGAHGTNQITTQYGITVGGWSEIGAIDSSFNTSNGILIGTRTNSKPIVFGNGGLERMRISNFGSVGIGTTTPFGSLQLSSTTGSAGFKPQFIISDQSAAANLKHWTLASVGGVFYLGTSTDLFATSSQSAFSIAGTGFGTTTVIGLNILGQATSTSNVGFNITTGCYAIGGTCLSSGGGGSGTVTSVIAGAGFQNQGLNITSSGTLVGAFATSATPVMGNLPYFTQIGDATTPAKFGTVATSSIASGTNITVTNGSTAFVLGAQPTINLSGIIPYSLGGTGTTTAPQGQLLYGGSTAYQSVATSSIGAAASLAFSGTAGAQVGGTNGTYSINTGNTNTWSVLQNFNYSSSTIYSSFLNASSTFYTGAGLATCNSASNALTWSGGTFGCNSITGGSGSSNPFNNISSTQSATTSTLAIGTTTPMSIGSFEIASNTPYSFITDANASVDAKHWFMANVDGAFNIGTTSDTSLAATSSAFSISAPTAASPNTTVGVATSSPWRTWSVNGSVGLDGLTASSGLQVGILCLSANKEVINESVACVASALRFKMNIQPLAVGLDEVLKLKPVSFNWKTDYNGNLQTNPNFSGTQYSLIADEVQKVDKNLVTVETEPTTFEGVNYPAGTVHGLADANHWTALFVKAIQELNAKTARSVEENWQWFALFIMFCWIIKLQIQIKKK